MKVIFNSCLQKNLLATPLKTKILFYRYNFQLSEEICRNEMVFQIMINDINSSEILHQEPQQKNNKEIIS